MNLSAVTLCLLPSIFLIISKCTSVRISRETCRGSNCSEFQCPGPYNCTCSLEPGYYRLACPNEDYLLISVKIGLRKHVDIECTDKAHFTDYELLRGLEVGSIPQVNVRLCPLPNMPLFELTKSIGINSITVLLFQSYRNLSNALQKKHLMGLDKLHRLVLSSNGLTDLPEDLLDGLNNLTWLDLKGNSIPLRSHFFSRVPKLVRLELANNHLKYLEPGIFSNLTQLKSLNLWQNQLQNLTRDVFKGLVSLEKLDLNSNKMTYMNDNVFQELTNLRELALFANNFTSLPEGLLSHNKLLERIRLYDNRQTLSTLPDHFLANLTNLMEVLLMRNNLSVLPPNTFWGSTKILNISLIGNLLRQIPKDLFRDQTELEKLNLSYNELTDLPDYIFLNLVKLNNLDIGHNYITNITSGVFKGLTSLRELNLENNRLKRIDYNAFNDLVELRIARFSHNRLSFKEKLQFSDKSPFRNSVKMEYLYLANNSITEMKEDWIISMTKLRSLDLSHNNVFKLEDEDFNFHSLQISVDLQYNNISVIDPKITSYGKNVRILLGENPLLCDCRNYNFFIYSESKLSHETNTSYTLVIENLRCAGPPQHKNESIKSVRSKELTCNISDMKDNKGERICPPECDCFTRTYDEALIINCSQRNLTSIPQSLPFLRKTNHVELWLTRNNLTEISPNDGAYKNVTHLYLSHNNISKINVVGLSRRMEVLKMDNNNFTTLDESLFSYITNLTHLKTLTLHKNPWRCDCENKNLLHFIQEIFQKVQFLPQVTCSDGETQLTSLSVSDLCPVSSGIIIASVIIAFFGIVVGALAALYYRFQQEVKVWLYAHRLCLWLVTEEELDKDKLYDAFISYSHKDEDFILNTLVPGLETGDTPFKLCLHYRDWIAGEWIPNQIARSVAVSRRTVVVLSPNFLESVWGRLEFQAAHKQALNEGRARVIIILYGDTGPMDDFDPELKAYITMNTYVKWGDPWFWSKLKYALPHPSNLVKGNVLSLKRRLSRRENKFIDDKLELIHTLDSPTTPPGATTPPAEVVTTMETVTPIINGGSVTNGHTKTVA